MVLRQLGMHLQAAMQGKLNLLSRCQAVRQVTAWVGKSPARREVRLGPSRLQGCSRHHRRVLSCQGQSHLQCLQTHTSHQHDHYGCTNLSIETACKASPMLIRHRCRPQFCQMLHLCCTYAQQQAHETTRLGFCDVIATIA